MTIRKFQALAWGILIYSICVILWGAYVRASGSGAGCGAHWPLCNGVVLPQNVRIQTWIEFSHRLTSGLSMILIGILGVAAYLIFPPGNRVRVAAGASVFFILGEALLGAGLVLYRLVEHDQSKARALSIALHLTNTLFLLATLCLTALWSRDETPVNWKKILPTFKQYWLAWVSFLVLGTTGAVTALGDTLFPSASLSEGMSHDFLPGSSFLIHLRVLHPLLAIGIGTYLIAIALSKPTRLGKRLAACIGIQLTLGFMNLLLSAPVAMQMIHLLVANAVWILLITWINERARENMLPNKSPANLDLLPHNADSLPSHTS